MSIASRLAKLEAQKPHVPDYEQRLRAILDGGHPGEDPALDSKLAEMMAAEEAGTINATPMEEMP